MSYYNGCRTVFSNQQKGIMLNQIFTTTKRLFIYTTEVNIVDPDQYEPDNSDFVGIPRLISVGETQCHSMSTIYEQEDCDDTEDWLRIENENGILSSYKIIVNDVDGSDNPVEDVIIHNTNNFQERTNELAVTFIDNGSERIWEIPCGLMMPNTNTLNPNDYNDFLVQIIRGDNEGGLYTVSLETSAKLPRLKNKNQICIGDEFSVLALPDGATVSWSSVNLDIDETTGSFTTITGTGTTGPYMLIAVITSGGCSYTINKEFPELGSSILPNIGNITMEAVGAACQPTFLFSIPPVSGATSYEWDCYTGPIINGYFEGCFGEGTSVYGQAQLEGQTTISITVSVTATNDCGATVTKSATFTYQPERDCDMHLTGGGGGDDKHLKITPNPVSSSEFTLEILDTSVETINYQIYILSQFGELTYMIESSEKIHQINTVNFVDGLYYAEVVTPTEVITTSFVIQN